MIYFDELVAKTRQKSKPSDKVLAISGSPRKGGNTDIIIKQMIAGLKSVDISSEHVNLGEVDFQGCVGCERCRRDKVCTRLKDGMSTIYPDIMESQGMILASPVHNYNITAWMKAFIDRLYCFYEFDNNTRPRQWSSRLANQGRKVVIAAICEQEQVEDMGFALEAMKRPMEALGFEVVGILPVFLAFEKGAVKKQQDIMDKAFELGVKLGEEIG
ncbi:flavodoxin family protein [Puteibacter caeruleilacunae]|nr:flavodoxin family protein [Puteibacter caeruleilacunae]